jgi:2-isopropylmalate synthase
LFDAEHFFDGFKANPDYAIKSAKAAYDAGALGCAV